MKNYLHILLQLGLALFFPLSGQTQDLKYPYRLFDLTFGPDTYYAKPMSSLGLKKSNYAVLVKVRLPGDTLYYTIPGVLPTGDSFAFRIKAGNRRHSDTLYLIRRGGVQTVQLLEVCILVFHVNDRAFFSTKDKFYTKTVLASYFDARTRPSGTDTPGLEISTQPSPRSMPVALLFAPGVLRQEPLESLPVQTRQAQGKIFRPPVALAGVSRD